MWGPERRQHQRQHNPRDFGITRWLAWENRLFIQHGIAKSNPVINFFVPLPRAKHDVPYHRTCIYVLSIRNRFVTRRCQDLGRLPIMKRIVLLLLHCPGWWSIRAADPDQRAGATFPYPMYSNGLTSITEVPHSAVQLPVHWFGVALSR